ncbi:pentapeptide repeat-containing protein [bacterium]|nr:pentapeptide repeat-containing protein [bacterium]
MKTVDKLMLALIVLSSLGALNAAGYPMSTLLFFGVGAFLSLLAAWPRRLAKTEAHAECWNLQRALRRDFSGANLVGMDLAGVDLSDVILRDADLSGVNLRRANFTGANLTRANLSGARCIGAVFHSANLYGANLTDADLGNADLDGADLWGADVTGAAFGSTKFANAFLQHVVGLTDEQAARARSRGAIMDVPDPFPDLLVE